ncbi:hypothetical protein Trydic_g3070 [Trypoxylus dichotomus]
MTGHKIDFDKTITISTNGRDYSRIHRDREAPEQPQQANRRATNTTELEKRFKYTRVETPRKRGKQLAGNDAIDVVVVYRRVRVKTFTFDHYKLWQEWWTVRWCGLDQAAMIYEIISAE